jgi:hypothetical protein
MKDEAKETWGKFEVSFDGLLSDVLQVLNEFWCFYLASIANFFCQKTLSFNTKNERMSNLFLALLTFNHKIAPQRRQ